MLSRFANPTFKEMIADQARFWIPGSPSTTELIQRFRSVEDKAINKVAGDLKKSLEKVGVESHWNIAPTVIGSEINALPLEQRREALKAEHQRKLEHIESCFIQSLIDGRKTNHIGEYEETGDRSCRVSFYERKLHRGVLNNREDTIKHTHELVDTRKHRLPALDLKKPKACSELIKALPEWIAKHSFIITGTQINGIQETVDEKSQPTLLLRTMRAVGRSTSAMMASVAEGLAAIPEMSLTMQYDPALVIGSQYALYGWND